MSANRKASLGAADMEALFGPDYAEKDTMHDLTHIRRIHRTAVELATEAAISCDSEVLLLAAYFHGIVDRKERAAELRTRLIQAGVSDSTVNRAIEAARESQKREKPTSPEGIVLHDGHLIEGGTSFLLVKTLVTGAARGSSLAGIIEYWNAHRDDGVRCVLAIAQKRFEKRVQFAQSVLSEIARDVEFETDPPAV